MKLRSTSSPAHIGTAGEKAQMLFVRQGKSLHTESSFASPLTLGVLIPIVSPGQA